tara:strand:+ start:3104 stop:3319 length:216 start_codon:yes stop_codon:yes gene_type:complete
VLSESDTNIAFMNEAQAETGTMVCYYFDWDMEYMGTGFGCSASDGYCSDVIDESSCTIYRFSGEPTIVISP